MLRFVTSLGRSFSLFQTYISVRNVTKWCRTSFRREVCERGAVRMLTSFATIIGTCRVVDDHSEKLI